MSHSADPIMVLVACSSEAEAKAIGKGLVKEKLAACAQVFPIQSVYTWENKLQEDREVMLQAKTFLKHIESIEQFVLENHKYEVPEVLAIPVIWGHGPYLDWMEQHT